MKIECRNDINIIFFAFRYSLGRTTTAPGIVINIIKKNWCDFPISDKKQFIREIERESQLNFGNTISISQQTATREWNNFNIWATERIRVDKISSIID